MHFSGLHCITINAITVISFNEKVDEKQKCIFFVYFLSIQGKRGLP